MLVDPAVREQLSIAQLGLEDERALCDGFTLYRVGSTILTIDDDGFSVTLFREFDSEEAAKQAFLWLLSGGEE